MQFVIWYGERTGEKCKEPILCMVHAGLDVMAENPQGVHAQAKAVRRRGGSMVLTSFFVNPQSRPLVSGGAGCCILKVTK